MNLQEFTIACRRCERLRHGGYATEARLAVYKRLAARYGWKAVVRHIPKIAVILDKAEKQVRSELQAEKGATV